MNELNGMVGWMDGWIDGWMDGRMDRQKIFRSFVRISTQRESMARVDMHSKKKLPNQQYKSNNIHSKREREREREYSYSSLGKKEIGATKRLYIFFFYFGFCCST